MLSPTRPPAFSLKLAPQRQQKWTQPQSKELQEPIKE